MNEREMAGAPAELETVGLVEGGEISVEVVTHRKSGSEIAVEGEAAFPEALTTPDIVSFIEQSDFTGQAGIAAIASQRLVLLAPNAAPVVYQSATSSTNVMPLRRGSAARIANNIEREHAA
jgi:hypothetical protein